MKLTIGQLVTSFILVFVASLLIGSCAGSHIATTKNENVYLTTEYQGLLYTFDRLNEFDAHDQRRIIKCKTDAACKKEWQRVNAD